MYPGKYDSQSSNSVHSVIDLSFHEHFPLTSLGLERTCLTDYIIRSYQADNKSLGNIIA
jgi:hypothetical protein